MIDVKQCSLAMSGVTVLDDITVTLNDGETIGIVGKSGSGKTAFLKTIAHRMPGYRGSITVNGTPLPLLKSTLEKEVTYCGQAVPANPDESLSEFLLQGRMPYKKAFRPYTDYDRQTADEYADILDLSRLGGMKIGTVPDGVFRRALLARAFIRGSHAVLLDNPTSDLDIASVGLLKKAIARYVMEGNRIAVVCSGDLNFISAVADRVLIMDAGRIVESGPVGILDGDLVKRYFGVDVIISRNIYNGKPQIHSFPEA
jgi:ABC-type cobalamin/Fe3+-siderophores transport system ATPase subunit